MFITLALKSLHHRKGSVVLTMMAMIISMMVLLGVEHIRHQAKANFANSISGVDLLVGARTSKINLLLYSVFRVGSPTQNISWQSFDSLANNAQVSWAIPISLGDSHKGYRVIGTTTDYFTHFKYGQQQALTFTQGKVFNHVYEVVLGADVARTLGYKLGDELILSHGLASTSFQQHDKQKFTVSGILATTGTPVDKSLHVSLQGIEAVHLSQAILSRLNDKQLSELKPKSVTAVMLGLTSKLGVFGLQREINTNPKEPLMALFPGVALSELWQTLSSVENTLRLISSLVFISALFGLSAMLLSSIRERQQEVRLLRMIGASPLFLFCFIELEALIIALASAIVAIVLLSIGLSVMQDYSSRQHLD